MQVSITTTIRQDMGDTVQAAVEQGIAGFAEQFRRLQARQDRLSAALVASEAKVDTLTERVTALKRFTERSELTRRRNNLVVYGLEEQAGVDAERAFARAAATAGHTEVTWLSVTRVGRPRERAAPFGARAGTAPPAAAPGGRPVLVCFGSADRKHALFKHARQFREAGVKLSDDLTPAQRAVRTELQDAFKALQGHNLTPFWRQERLFYTDGGVRKQYRSGDDMPARPGQARPAGRLSASGTGRGGASASGPGAAGAPDQLLRLMPAPHAAPEHPAAATPGNPFQLLAADEMTT